MQFSLTFQQEILPNTVVSIAYQGSQGRRLPRLTNDANLAIPTKVNGRTFFPEGPIAIRGVSTGRQPKRNLNFAGVRMELWDANSFYNAMKIGLNKRFSSGFQLQVSYNKSKFIDDSSNVGHYDDQGSSPDPDDHKSGRGFSGLHVRHTFSTNFTYDLPLSQQGLMGSVLGGWQINGIFTAADGPTDTIFGTFCLDFRRHHCAHCNI